MKDKIILVFMILFLNSGLVSALEIIENQNVEYGDVIKQYALLEIDDNGAVYTIACDNCSMFISISDGDGINYVTNQSMNYTENGLFTYPSLGLTYYKSYIAKFESISHTYGGSIIFYSEFYVGDNSEWVGDVTLDTPSLSTNEAACEYDDVVLELACLTEGQQEEFQNYEIPFFGIKLGIIGDLFFALHVTVLFISIIIFNIGGTFINATQTSLVLILSFLGFVNEVIEPTTRELAINNGLTFIYEIIMVVLKPFYWFFVIAQPFIIYKAAVIKNPANMMIYYFEENFKIVKGVLNVILQALNLVFGIITGIIA